MKIIHSCVTCVLTYDRLLDKERKTFITIERSRMSQSPFRLFLSMMTLTYGQNMSKIGVDQLGRFPRRIM